MTNLLRRLKPVLTVAMAVALAFLIATAPSHQEDRARSIGRQIRCPVCAGESIADSPSQLAVDMMTMVRELVAEGASDAQVISQVLAGYGSDAQLLDPGMSRRTVILWALPAIALALGLGAIIRRRRPTMGGPD